MRKRSRIIAVALMVLAISAVSVLVFNPFAKADPPSLAIDSNNGYQTQRFTHPDNDGWYVDVAVDTHRGLLESSTSNYLSGVARITRGVGVKRTQIDAIRLVITGVTVNDYFVSKFSSARDNTPPGCTLTSGTTVSLYADRSSEVGCQPGPNRLNSDADYAGNVAVVRGYTDWQGPVGCGTHEVATRGFFAVRWADNSYSQFTLRTEDNVQANPEC
jgi:hypothetical protein